MVQQSVILTFPKELVDRPVISGLVRDRGVEVNILQARVTPEEDGHMFAILRGTKRAVRGALAYLDEAGVRVVLPAQNILWDRERCVHCGACVGQCPSSALTVEPASRETAFHEDRCIACELCIPSCGYGALASVGDHLRKTGEL